jgi:NAD(P)-dependent dehydrogenase (short-subunit alcohol dehydrogenase family)
MSFPGIEGKVAIVTGAGGGIGEGYAKALASEGAKVAIAEIVKENGERVAEEIRSAGGEARFVEVDVASESSTLAMAETVSSTYGGIDFLVNNAAIFGTMKLDSLLNVDLDYYRKFMSVNVDGALLCTRACHKSMKERGGGSIVNQSSTASWMGVGYYGLSKLSTNGLTHCLAKELGHANIRVNAIAPGPTDTEALANQVPDAYKDQLVSSLALPRLGQPADMASACLFLLSDASAWITGQILAVDGGQIVRA